jgi:hypothetical protein
VLQSYNVSRIDVFIWVRQRLLSIVHDLPFVEVRGAVGLTFSVDCIRIRPS